MTMQCINCQYLFRFHFFSCSDRNASTGMAECQKELEEQTLQSVIRDHYVYKGTLGSCTGECQTVQCEDGGRGTYIVASASVA